MIMQNVDITSKEVPYHKLFDVVEIHYRSNDGVLARVPGQIIGGSHPNYVIEFTVGQRIMRVVTMGV